MRIPLSVAMAVATAVAWVALWNDISWANVIVGVVMAAVVVYPQRDRLNGRSVDPIALGHFGWLVLVDLVRSTIAVAREVVTPTDHTDEAIIAVVIEPDAVPHLLLLTVAITLTPGTAAVDSDPENSTLYLHLLHSPDEEATVVHTHKLAALAVAAFPTRQGVVT